jgi:hypothetical protein
MASSLGAANKILGLFHFLLCHQQYAILLYGSLFGAGNKVIVLFYYLLCHQQYEFPVIGSLCRCRQ